MHKDYEKNDLYSVEPENINSVFCCQKIMYMITFNLANGDSVTKYNPDEAEQKIYTDICERLKATGKFVKVGLYLINLANIQDIRIEESDDSVVVRYKNRASDCGIISCKDRCEANKVYEYLTEQFNNYKTQPVNTEQIISK